MLKKMKHRMIALYTATTGLILTIILTVTFFYQQSILEKEKQSAFQNLILDLSSKLETESLFSDSWLAKMEVSNQAVIYIEENNKPFFFPGAWKTKTERTLLIEKARQMAMLEDIYTDQKPFVSSMKRSSIFHIRGNHKDTYLGCVLVLSYKENHKSLVLLCDLSQVRETALYQCLFFLILDILGILALFYVSRILVTHSMKPIAEYHQKQTDFIAAASHELRSPLAVIQTSAQAIPEAPDQREQLLNTINKECHRAGTLVKNLLLLASADSEKLFAEKENFEADTLLLNLYESYEPICREKGIALHLSLPEDLLPDAQGHPLYLYQVLAILMDNAVSYGCENIEHPCIDICAVKVHKQLILSVTDHGPGIPDEQKQLIYDRFYRADTSRTKKEHFGLGLNIASELCKIMKVPLSLEDTPGGGCTFSLRITVSNE